MNWDTYKQFSAKQKEEYNFRFKGKAIRIDFNLIAYYMFALIIGYFGVVVLIALGERGLAMQFRDSILMLATTLLWVIIGMYSIFAVYNSVKLYQEFKWTKKALQEKISK